MSTSVPHKRPDSAPLGWSVRSYAWLIVVCAVVGGVLLPALRTMQPVTYEAKALVVADTLELSSAALPRFGAAVFSSGAVARSVASDVGGDPDVLIPERLDVVTAQDSVVFQVIGRDRDPVVAERLANSAADAFLIELNKSGSGVGSFSLQDEAQVPTVPADSGPGPAVSAATGALAGTVLGFGLVALLTALRRPVVGAGEVEEVLGVPILGSVLLPRSRSHEFPGPRGVPGLASVTRWLVDSPAPRVFIASSPRAAAARQRISVMLTVTLSQFRAVELQGAATLRLAVRQLMRTTSDEAPRRPEAGRDLLLVDGAEPLDSIDPAGGPTVTVLVVREGTPRETLRTMAAEYMPDELFGVVMFRTSRRRVRRGNAAIVSRLRSGDPGGAEGSTDQKTGRSADPGTSGASLGSSRPG